MQRYNKTLYECCEDDFFFCRLQTTNATILTQPFPFYCGGVRKHFTLASEAAG